ncbi:MAG TPA: oxalate/formate MFS antiporter [Candidatus Acidoferrales bacterium]|jgi:OFA family oxalate/formate antiporter-like MFS transporter|nr:oxalate/formate MFS antiporter [Candidatus Acidoferrales bacterium]
MAVAPVSPASLIHPSRIPNRWVQLVAGIVAMMAIANLQYAWTLFTKPIQAHLHVSLEAVQWTIVLFVALETWLVPFEGFLVDRIGPRFMLGIGAILAGLGWIGSGRAESLYGLYFWYGLGGIGAGAVYGGTIGNALKWFPDHRGLCVGLTAGAFGIGTATTIAPIAAMLKTSGYQHTFIFWGIVQGVVVLAASLFLARPPVGWTPPNWKEKEAKIKAKVKTSSVDMTPWEMLRQPSFYVIYLMMTMLAFGGIVVTVQLNPMASSYHVDKVVVLWGMTALVLAITVDRILNGLTRPFWGWVSDHIGRENAIFISFILEAIAVYALLQLISHPVWFVALSGLCFFAWGNIYSLFPSITGDLYGNKWATTNYGIVYTAKGVATAFAGPGAAWLFAKTGSWTKVFWAMIICDLIAAFMALLWLKPLAARMVRDSERTPPLVSAATPIKARGVA